MDLTPLTAAQMDRFLIAGKPWAIWSERFRRAGLMTIPGAWLSSADVRALQSAGNKASLWKEGEMIASHLSGGPHPEGLQLPASETSLVVRYAWDLLTLNERIMAECQQWEQKGTIHPHAIIDGELQLGEGSILLPGVYIEGKVTIGKGCKIGPNCYLRGATSIGDECRIGQSVEVKNSLIGSRVKVSHLSYLGDSVVGDGVNLGAGTITANFRYDGGNHLSQIGEQLINTGRRKFGAIFGEKVHTGIHTSIYPGRKLGSGTTTLPGELVKYDKLPCAE